MPEKTIEELRNEIDESREPCARAFAECARMCRAFIECGGSPVVPESFLAHSWVASVARLERVAHDEIQTDGVVLWLQSIAYCIAAIPALAFEETRKFADAIGMLERNLSKIKTLNARIARENEK